jgi:hypothetical protein
MFTYRLHLEVGSDAGEATYAQMIKPGEEILVGNGRRKRGGRSARRSGPRLSVSPVKRRYVGLAAIDSPCAISKHPLAKSELFWLVF